MGYTKEWIAAELGVPWSRVRYWIQMGYVRGAAGQGARNGYSSEFVAACRALSQFLELNPRGPLENWRDRYYPPDDWDEDE